MAATFKALSVLLSYPTEALQEAIPELRAIIVDEGIVTGLSGSALALLIDEIEIGDIFDLQERYVDLFDRTRSLSLHLFEHVHGESRDRGQAMIDLKDQYAASGLSIEGGELPDFLPLFLEFLSTQSFEEARDMLAQAAHVIAALEARLEKRQSSYAAILAALAAMVPDAVDAISAVEDVDVEPEGLAALDAAWEEAPVTFGPEAGTGCKDDLIARMRAARRPAATAGGGLPNA